jgi:glycosyltransferase involved in cell wall biosynthesis
MRFAFISGMSGHPWGGSEELWSQTAIKLRKEGHEVMAIVKDWSHVVKQQSQLESHGISLVKYQDSYSGRKDILKNALLSPGTVGKLRPFVLRRLVKFKPDLVCVSHGSVLCGLQWMLDCRAAKLRYVSIAQANFEQWWPNDNQIASVHDAYIGAAKSYFVSQANLKLFEVQIAHHLSNACVIWNPCGVGFDALLPWPNVPDGGTWNLACVARLEPSAKGQDILFEVMAQSKWKERPIHLEMYGRGCSENGTRRLADFYNLGNRVEFKGHVNDVRGIWKTNHCLVLPSRYEGMPLSLIECLLCGRPAITTAVAGNPEIVQDDVNGFLTYRVDAHGLDEAMERAWSRRIEWSAMGRTAHRMMVSQIGTDPIESYASELLCIAESS